MKNFKRFALTCALSLSFAAPIVAHAELVGHYSWGYFYSVMTKSTVTSEVDPTTSKKVRAVAQNSKTTKRGPLVAKNKASIATVSRTSHGNKTFYSFN